MNFVFQFMAMVFFVFGFEFLNTSSGKPRRLLYSASCVLGCLACFQIARSLQ